MCIQKKRTEQWQIAKTTRNALSHVLRGDTKKITSRLNAYMHSYELWFLLPCIWAEMGKKRIIYTFLFVLKVLKNQLWASPVRNHYWTAVLFCCSFFILYLLAFSAHILYDTFKSKIKFDCISSGWFRLHSTQDNNEKKNILHTFTKATYIVAFCVLFFVQ